MENLNKKLTEEDEKELARLENPDRGMKHTKFTWSVDFQRLILSAMLHYEGLLAEVSPVLKQGYWTENAHQLIYSIVKDYHDQYRSLPDMFWVTQQIEEQAGNEKARNRFCAEYNQVRHYFKPGVQSLEALRDYIMQFCKVQTAREAMINCLEKMKEGKFEFDKCRERLEFAEDLGTTKDVLTYAELMELAESQEPDWIWEDLIDKGTLTLFSGLPFSGKTTLVNQLLGKVVTGQEFLGKVTTRCPVIYINADHYRERLIIRNVLKTGFTEEQEQSLKDLFFCVKPESTVTTAFLNSVLESVRDAVSEEMGNKVLIVIDTLRSALLSGAEAGSENDSTVMTSALKPLRAWCNDTGASIILLHHNNRSRDDYAGSAGIAGCVHGTWNISKKEGEQVSTFRAKTREDFHCFLNLKMTETGLRVTADLDADAGERNENFLDSIPPDKWLAISDLMHHTDLSRATCQRRIDHATQNGFLFTRGEGVKGDPKQWMRMNSV